MAKLKLSTALFALAALLVVAIASTSGAASTKTVSVKDSSFSPKSLKVSKGTRVTWVWKGDLPHDVIAKKPGKFRSKLIDKGKFSVTFKKPGKYKYVCSLHTDIGMVGTVTVK